MSHERSVESSIYGHQYTPKTIAKYEAPALDTLECQGVKFVRLTWVDFSNTTRYRVIPISHFRKIMAAAKPSISMVSAAPAFFFNNVPPGFGVFGENPYVPDMKSLRLTAYAPGHATLFGWFEPKHEDVPPPPCPRKLLRKIVE
jgi:glutamine synthetase